MKSTKAFKQTMIEYKSVSRKLRIIAEEGSPEFQKAKLCTGKDSYEYAKRFYNSDIYIYESFFVILLNRCNNTIGWFMMSQGGINGTVVDPKIIAKFAVESLASSVILIHNHPSGSVQPSEADIVMVKKMKEGLSFLDITILDALIITESTYYSFADESLI